MVSSPCFLHALNNVFQVLLGVPWFWEIQIHETPTVDMDLLGHWGTSRTLTKNVQMRHKTFKNPCYLMLFESRSLEYLESKVFLIGRKYPKQFDFIWFLWGIWIICEHELNSTEWRFDDFSWQHVWKEELLQCVKNQLLLVTSHWPISCPSPRYGEFEVVSKQVTVPIRWTIQGGSIW